jgi:branched-chain amino acid transport system permease protein
MPFVLSPVIGHHHALVFGVVMVLAILFQPRGLIGVADAARRRLQRRRQSGPA